MATFAVFRTLLYWADIDVLELSFTKCTILFVRLFPYLTHLFN
jgi:hypothetical protein